MSDFDSRKKIRAQEPSGEKRTSWRRRKESPSEKSFDEYSPPPHEGEKPQTGPDQERHRQDGVCPRAGGAGYQSAEDGRNNWKPVPTRFIATFPRTEAVQERADGRVGKDRGRKTIQAGVPGDT